MQKRMRKKASLNLVKRKQPSLYPPMLTQDPVLFAGTLRWNMDPHEEYTDEALWCALEQAHLKEFVSDQEAGLGYEITEGGDNLR